MSTKAKTALAVGAVLAAILYLILTGFSNSMVYYLELSEFLAEGEGRENRAVRINGAVQEGSIKRDEKENLLEFTLTDGKLTMDVVYEGIIPDLFKENADVVVEGRKIKDSPFRADTILTKCPSKYEAKSPVPPDPK